MTIRSWNFFFFFFTGNILANETTADFNQSIPSSIIDSLFSNPVNLSNLHQPWFINRTNSLSNINVAAEIYLSSIETNFSYVSLRGFAFFKCKSMILFSLINPKQILNNHFVLMVNSIEHFQWTQLNGRRQSTFYVIIYQQLIWKIF